MPIEFRCPQCQKLLRVPDESAGRPAKCPACEAVLTVPAASSLAPAQQGNPFAPSESPREPDSLNPYQAPAFAEPMIDPSRSAGPRVFQPTIISPFDVLSRSWEIFKARMAIVLVSVILTGVISYAIYFVFYMAALVVAVVVNEPAVLALLIVPAILAFYAIMFWLVLGLFRVLIGTARGDHVTLKDLFGGGPYFLRAAGATLLFIIGSSVLLYGPAVPALILESAGASDAIAVTALLAGLSIGFVLYLFVWLTYGQYLFLVLDRDAGVFESFSISRHITRGNRWRLLFVYFIAACIAPAGCIACGMGMIFTYPFAALIVALTYLAMTGQPTIESYRTPATTQPPLA